MTDELVDPQFVAARCPSVAIPSAVDLFLTAGLLPGTFRPCMVFLFSLLAF